MTSCIQNSRMPGTRPGMTNVFGEAVPRQPAARSSVTSGIVTSPVSLRPVLRSKLRIAARVRSPITPSGGARIVTELVSSAWARETSATFSFCAPELVAASSPHSAFAASSLASGFADFACYDFTASSAAASDTGSSFVFARRFVAEAASPYHFAESA